MLLFKKLTRQQADCAIKEIEIWFKKNPNRRVCRTQVSSIRRGYVREDVMKYTEGEITE